MGNEIYCYGGIDIYNAVFNAIAMMNADRSFMQSLISIGVLVGGFWTMITLIFGDFIKPFLHWVIPMAVLQAAFLTPTARVHLIDVVQENRHEVVDHVPYGLALIAGTLSRISHRITEKTELYFHSVNDIKYSKTGGIFAANLVENQKLMTIQDEDFAENMRSFIGQCVLYDVALGRKYTMKQLRNTNDIWGLVSANASPARSFLWKEQHNQGDIVTCAEGVQRFNTAWNAQIDQTACAVGARLYPSHDSNSAMQGGGTPISVSGGTPGGTPDQCKSPLARSEFIKFLPLQYAALTGIGQHASEILKQQMMISAIVDAQDYASTAAGNMPNFAARKAYFQQRSSYENIGLLASDTLPVMRAVLELLCYAIFLFIIPILVLPMGYKILVSWTQTVLWLAMWPPLYAVLHLIMVSAIAMKTKAFVGISNAEGITIASSLGVQNISADMAAMAGYLSMTIPFICISIVKGVSSFVHMAGSLGAVSQGAASSAATEALTGSYSLRNTSMDNHSFGNMNQLSQSYSANLSTGSTLMQEGRMGITTDADGGSVVNIGQSSLPLSMNLEKIATNSKRELSQQQMVSGQSLVQSVETTLGSSVDKVGHLGQVLSNSTNTQEGWTETEQKEIGQAMQMMDQAVKKLSKDSNISEGKAALVLASVGTPGLGQALFGASASADLTSMNENRDTISKAKEISKQMNFEENARISMQAAKHLSQHSSDDKVKSYAQSQQVSLNKAARDSSLAQKHFDTSRSLSKEADMIESQSVAFNRNHNDKFFEYLANQSTHSSGGRMGERAAAAMIYNNPTLTEAYARQYMRENIPNQSQALGETEESLKADYHARPMPSAVDTGVVERFDEQARGEITHEKEEEAAGMRHRVEAEIVGTKQFIKNAKQEVINPAREELEKEHSRKSTDVGITTALFGGLKAIKNAKDSPLRFVEEQVDNVKEMYTKRDSGQQKEDTVYSNFSSMITTSMRGDGSSSSMEIIQEDSPVNNESVIQHSHSDVQRSFPEKMSTDPAPHDGSLESLFKPQTTVATADSGSLGNLRVPENDFHQPFSEKPDVSAGKLVRLDAQTTEQQPSKIVKVTQVKNVPEEEPLTGLKKNNNTRIESK